MTLARIKETLDVTPFRPFVIHLADGPNVVVQHPDFVIHSPDGKTLVVFEPDSRMRIIDLPLVTELEIQTSRGRKKAA